MPEIADLLLMQQKLRKCVTLAQLRHFVVNDSARIAPFRTAVLWQRDDYTSEISAVSGLPEPIANIPFTSWANELCETLAVEHRAESFQVDPSSFTDKTKWSEFFPGAVAWVPLSINPEENVGGLLLGRDESWPQEELRLLDYWGQAVAHAIYALENSTAQNRWRWQQLRDKRVLWAIVAVVVVLAFLPVSLSVNASAEVVPKNPSVVRSPLDAIVGEVLVAPNSMVRKGDQILSFDDTSIRAQLDVVNQELAISRAELQRTTQASVSDRRVSSELPMLQARVEQSEARVKYTQSLLERSRIFAASDGIVIIPIASELEGKPMQVGQKLFTLATPGQVELEFWLAIGDSIPLPDAAEVVLFLNVYPDRSHIANIRYMSYQAEVSPAGILGFRGRADFTETTDLRVGWRGTAKLYGEQVSLFYLIFRRPLSVLRQWIGV